MKKTKIKQRFANAADAFFTEEDSCEDNSISFVNNSNISRKEMFAGLAEKADVFVSILKQVFLFFPGTFYLFIVSLAFGLVTIIQPPGALRFDLIWIALAFLVSVFAVWFGIGDLKKPKHFIIPASIVSMSFVFGVTSGVLIILFPAFEKIVEADSFPLYLFPLALIVPFLAKGWVDRKNEN
jgi:hypothetical protein